MEASKLKFFILLLMTFSCLIISERSSAARLSVLFGGSAGSSGNGKSSVRVFVTSTQYDGNLGGIAGADEKCQARADAANLGGTWKAIISDTTTTAIARLKNRAKPVYNLSGKLVFTPGVPIFRSGTGTTVSQPFESELVNSVWFTELGTVAPQTTTWTGSYSAGNSSTNNCTNWTSNSAGVNGQCGDNQSKSSTWIQIGTSSPCNTLLPLYCLEGE